MQTFTVRLEPNLFYARGERIRQLAAGGDFVIVAEDKDKAVYLARAHIGDRVSQTSPRIITARYDDISEWLERREPNEGHRKIIEVVEDAISLLGSIDVKGMLIESRADEADTLVVHLEEEGRTRLLIEQVFAQEEGLLWLDDEIPFTVGSLIREIQYLF